MRTYERNGVHVDQCSDCRGIFLDRGELDRLIDAENSWHGGAAPRTSGSQQSPGHSGSDEERDDHERSGGRRSGSAQGLGSAAGLSGVVGEVLRQVQGSSHSSHSTGHGKRRKQSFLGELFG
ncbi:conserved protein of unknown function [Blastococcus saxobsidens DD2]|uniref:Transcription factor zinc-finger domain-containing protein n=2 Tax=Blastococcus saxobsidens TaxID=138336 RepID=H6RML5_BLASD|nr:conserved protein of unknown function [Blastococcus saxobsidens DD2]